MNQIETNRNLTFSSTASQSKLSMDHGFDKFMIKTKGYLPYSNARKEKRIVENMTICLMEVNAVD